MSFHRTIIRLSALLAVVALAKGCGDGDSPSAPPTPEPARPTTVTVSPATHELTALGTTVQLSAEVRDQNARVMAGATVTWTSSASSMATVDASGLVTAAGNGTATITASVGSASGSAVVTVQQSVASVEVSPSVDELTALGQTVQLTAEAFDENGHAVAGAEFSWESSDAAVATVDAGGLVTAVAEGVATITASAGEASGSAVVTVMQPVASVEVSPSAETIGLGSTLQLTAEAFDENGEAVAGVEFSWESSDVAVATVDASGLVTAVRGGNATITATYEEITAESVISVWISTLGEGSVRVLYVVPADREFRDDYSDGISRAIVDVQSWYRRQLDGLTFDIYSVIPEQCHLPGDEDYYSHGDVWKKVLTDVQSCAPVQGGTSRFIWALYVDAEERCGEPHELGRGGDGLAMMGSGDLEGLSNPGPYSACDGGPWEGTFGRWMGGTAHELGHTFLVPHPPGCEEGLPTCDHQALMWNGYENYPDTYLRDDEKAILRRSPFIKR